MSDNPGTAATPATPGPASTPATPGPAATPAIPDIFTPDYRIVIVSSLGIIGLLLALILLGHEGNNGPKGAHTGSVFHEIGYRPRDAVARAIKSVMDTASTADSATLAALKVIRKTYEDSSLNDTAGLTTMNRWLHFRLTPDDLVKWGNRYDTLGKDWFVHVPYHARFTANARTFYVRDTIDFIVRSYHSNIQFIEKYPGAGIWVFLQLLFSSFCFIAGSVALFIRHQVVTTFKAYEKPDRYGYWLTSLGVAVSLAALYLILAFTFIDEMPVKGLFFMRNLDSVLIYGNVIGGIAGAFCLAGFIHSASVLGYFATKFNAQAKTLMAQPEFRQLIGFFHRYFILSAILLSLATLCTGALYNAANSMDFVKLLIAKWGYSPAGGDAVYLYGGLYTAILLLVYLPAKMQFDIARSKLPPDQRPGDGDDDKLYSYLDKPFSFLKGGLIAATPFLTGILQSLMNTLFNH